MVIFKLLFCCKWQTNKHFNWTGSFIKTISFFMIMNQKLQVNVCGTLKICTITASFDQTGFLRIQKKERKKRKEQSK